MDARDEKIRFEILSSLYRQFEEDPLHARLSNEDIAEENDQIESDEIDYIIDRIDGEYVDAQSYAGGLIDVEITSRGIEHLSSQGVQTLLDTSLRYDILQAVYKVDREHKGNFLRVSEFTEQAGAAESEVLANLKYLKQKRLVSLMSGWNGIEITNKGRNKYESYRDDGVEIPSSSTSQSTRQAEIGRGDEEQAENLFRDIVELASSEVRILDRYAKLGIFTWVNTYIPSGVSVKVLTSGQVTGGDYADEIASELDDSMTVEIRELPNHNWDFHDRYVFRDEDMGWSWGHSFHDSGDRQHTPTELKPVNRRRIIQKFDDAWEQATSVM